MIMNSKIMTQAIRDRLKIHGFRVESGVGDIIDVKLNNLPSAIIKEVKSSIENIQNNSYQTLYYKVILLAKASADCRSDPKKTQYSSDTLKEVIFGTLKEVLDHQITTRVDLETLNADKAKYTIHNEISVSAEFNIKTIYHII